MNLSFKINKITILENTLLLLLLHTCKIIERMNGSKDLNGKRGDDLNETPIKATSLKRKMISSTLVESKLVEEEVHF